MYFLYIYNITAEVVTGRIIAHIFKGMKKEEERISKVRAITPYASILSHTWEGL